MSSNFDFVTIPNISLLSKEYLDDITFIESVSNTPSWTDKMFEAEFVKNNAYFYGIFYNRKVVGFLLINTVFDEAHILKFGILPEFRGKGLGTKLLSYTVEESKQKGQKYMWLEVRKSNEIALKLYSSQGFKLQGVRKEYYADNNEDAYIMVLEINNK